MATTSTSTSWVLQSLRGLVSDLAVYSDGRHIPADFADGFRWRIEMMTRELLAMDACGELTASGREALRCLSQAYTRMGTIVDHLSRSHADEDLSPYQADVVATGSVGRPRFDVPRSQLEYLVNNRFSVPEIANLVGVSISTVRRRMTLYHLSVHQTYTQIGDNELDRLVHDAQLQFPSWGNRLMYSYLLSCGVRVPFHRVREAQARIDPMGSFMRRLRRLHRRRYEVPGPQALWHIDGNHKLIRWKMVIHGAIDGYSRMIVYMRCSDNNRATTVLESFVEGVRVFGCPSRVRGDRGGENVRVADFMIVQRGPGRASFICGRSVHNQRIERLWRDVFASCTVLYYNLFYDMETCDILDSDNEVHIFCLQYVFLPRINLSLEQFLTVWNNHPLRTERNRSPYQMWLSGRHAVPHTLDTPEMYGIDWDGPLPDDFSDCTVEVPPVLIPIANDDYTELCSLINPLASSAMFGVDLYLECLDFVHRKMNGQ